MAPTTTLALDQAVLTALQVALDNPNEALAAEIVAACREAADVLASLEVIA